ncbi:hypothetical protein DPEC_G00305540 [Dallia pectoralis]|uniref:Uncharacterized protein n=1 Tax=Dallia pectoralis TaxID=75939 RepID=A0ACC2FDV3_DALPE|nr:hypothetical protein DPEC_G00305540 [Dallia pectoralis]
MIHQLRANIKTPRCRKSYKKKVTRAKIQNNKSKAMASPVSMVARRVLAAASHTGQDAGSVKTWKILSYVVALPGVAVCMVNAYLKMQHKSHENPEFVSYSHLRVRTKKWPWGDGNHSLFHNPHTNALPGGYEGPHH